MMKMESYPKGTWIRSPHLSQHKPFTKEEGALIFVKTGHLPIVGVNNVYSFTIADKL